MRIGLIVLLCVLSLDFAFGKKLRAKCFNNFLKKAVRGLATSHVVKKHLLDVSKLPLKLKKPATYAKRMVVAKAFDSIPPWDLEKRKNFEKETMQSVGMFTAKQNLLGLPLNYLYPPSEIVAPSYAIEGLTLEAFLSNTENFFKVALPFLADPNKKLEKIDKAIIEEWSQILAKNANEEKKEVLLNIFRNFFNRILSKEFLEILYNLKTTKERNNLYIAFIQDIVGNILLKFGKTKRDSGVRVNEQALKNDKVYTILREYSTYAADDIEKLIKKALDWCKPKKSVLPKPFAGHTEICELPLPILDLFMNCIISLAEAYHEMPETLLSLTNEMRGKKEKLDAVVKKYDLKK